MKEIENLTFTDESLLLAGNSLEDSVLKLAEATRYFGLGEVEGDEINYEIPSLGYCVVTDHNKIVKRIYLEVGGEGGYIKFPFKFRGLNSQSNREMVRKTLGEPKARGEEVKGRIRCYGAWDAFLECDNIIHFEYSANASVISKVVIGVPSEFPF